MTYSDGNPLAMRHLEGERATKWRGGAVRQEPQMTLPHRKAAVWWSGHRFGQFVSLRMTVCCLPLSSSRAGLPVVMSDRYSSLMKRRAERSPATLGRATFRSEISPLRFAFVEMTGRGGIIYFFTVLLALGLMGRQFLPLSDYISREAKRPGRNPSYAAAHNPWKRRGEDRSLHEIHLSGAPTI